MLADPIALLLAALGSSVPAYGEMLPEGVTFPAARLSRVAGQMVDHHRPIHRTTVQVDVWAKTSAAEAYGLAAQLHEYLRAARGHTSTGGTLSEVQVSPPVLTPDPDPSLVRYRMTAHVWAHPNT